MIVNATGIPANAIQRKVFTWEEGDPCPQPYQLNSTMLEPCVPLQRYDYFEVISIPYTILVHYLMQPLSSCNFTFPSCYLIRKSLKAMCIHSIIGKRAGVHIRLCFSRVCTDSLRRCRLRPGQASESAKKTIENSPRGDTKKKRW